MRASYTWLQRIVALAVNVAVASVIYHFLGADLAIVLALAYSSMNDDSLRFIAKHLDDK